MPEKESQFFKLEEMSKKESAEHPKENTEEQKQFECRQHEQNLVIENPEFVGINFDQDFIIDARNYWSQKEWLQYIQERDGQISKEIREMKESGQAQKIISDKREKENRKKASFEEYLSSFEGKLQYVRVHPEGECSPVTPSQAIEVKPSGTWEVVIAPEFIDQMKKLQDQCSDLTIVVQFYDHRRKKEKASDVPETQQQIDQYIAICEKIVENIDEDVQLEIGNETNVCRNTGPMFDKKQFASHVDPAEYSRFFFEVARIIKEKSPKTRLSVAGVACFDPTYLKEVLRKVKRLQLENGIEVPLVDTISFHPYREKPENGSVEVRDGKFKACEIDYEGQMEEMQKIASEFDLNLTVGEINFPFSDPEQKTKLKQALSSTSDKKIVSLIYPGVNVH